MKLEDDVSVGTIACPYCGAAKSVPCEPVRGSWIGRDRKYVRSHADRIRAAVKKLYDRAGEMERDGEDGSRLVVSAGKLSAELARRARQQRRSRR